MADDEQLDLLFGPALKSKPRIQAKPKTVPARVPQRATAEDDDALWSELFNAPPPPPSVSKHITPASNAAPLAPPPPPAPPAQPPIDVSSTAMRHAHSTAPLPAPAPPPMPPPLATYPGPFGTHGPAPTGWDDNDDFNVTLDDEDGVGASGSQPDGRPHRASSMHRAGSAMSYVRPVGGPPPGAPPPLPGMDAGAPRPSGAAVPGPRPPPGPPPAHPPSQGAGSTPAGAAPSSAPVPAMFAADWGSGRPQGLPTIGSYARQPQFISVATGAQRPLLPMDAAFPGAAKPDQAIKLPRQTRVSGDEYKEFLSLGHGEIFDLDLDRVIEAPWRHPQADPTDYFNYGLTERTWRDYQRKVQLFRASFNLKGRIQTLGSSGDHMGFSSGGGGAPSRPGGDYDGGGWRGGRGGPPPARSAVDADLPPEVSSALMAERMGPRGNTSDRDRDQHRNTIAVFEDADGDAAAGASLGRDDSAATTSSNARWRRSVPRLDPEVILELTQTEGPPASWVNTEYDPPAPGAAGYNTRFKPRGSGVDEYHEADGGGQGGPSSAHAGTGVSAPPFLGLRPPAFGAPNPMAAAAAMAFMATMMPLPSAMLSGPAPGLPPLQPPAPPSHPPPRPGVPPPRPPPGPPPDAHALQQAGPTAASRSSPPPPPEQLPWGRPHSHAAHLGMPDLHHSSPPAPLPHEGPAIGMPDIQQPLAMPSLYQAPAKDARWNEEHASGHEDGFAYAPHDETFDFMDEEQGTGGRRQGAGQQGGTQRRSHDSYGGQDTGFGEEDLFDFGGPILDPPAPASRGERGAGRHDASGAASVLDLLNPFQEEDQAFAYDAAEEVVVHARGSSPKAARSKRSTRDAERGSDGHGGSSSRHRDRKEDRKEDRREERKEERRERREDRKEHRSGRERSSPRRDRSRERSPSRRDRNERSERSDRRDRSRERHRSRERRK